MELRNDERVVCMERTNIRYVKPEDIGILADFSSIDVSFISLKKVIPVVINLLKDDGELYALSSPSLKRAGKRSENMGLSGTKRSMRK